MDKSKERNNIFSGLLKTTSPSQCIAKAFERFSQLPLELRLLVWSFVEFQPRVVQLYGFQLPTNTYTTFGGDVVELYNTEIFTRQHPISLLSVCRDARQVALKSFSQHVLIRNKSAPSFSRIQEHIDKKVRMENVCLDGINFIAPTQSNTESSHACEKIRFNMDTDVFYLADAFSLSSWICVTVTQEFPFRFRTYAEHAGFNMDGMRVPSYAEYIGFDIPSMETRLGTSFVRGIKYLIVTVDLWNSCLTYLMLHPQCRTTFLHLPSLKSVDISRRPHTYGELSDHELMLLFAGRLGSVRRSWPNWKIPVFRIVSRDIVR